MIVAVQFMVPTPVLETENVVVPDEDATSRLSGVTERTGGGGVPACVTVTSLGLPAAPGAVTRIIPCREDVLMF